jgi:hypothetical protein
MLWLGRNGEESTKTMWLMLAAANGKRSQQPLLGTGCINKKMRAFPSFPEKSGTDPLLLPNRFLLIALSFSLTS